MQSTGQFRRTCGKPARPDAGTASGASEVAVSITPAEAEALRGRVEREGAARTIEVGLGYGVSALAVCAALPRSDGACHVVIDPFQDTRFGGEGLRRLEEAGLAHLVE